MHQDCDEATQAGVPLEMVRSSSSREMIHVNDCTSLVTYPEVSDDRLGLFHQKAEAGAFHQSIRKNGEVEVEVILSRRGSHEAAQEDIPVTREHHQHQEEQVISILDCNTT